MSSNYSESKKSQEIQISCIEPNLDTGAHSIDEIKTSTMTAVATCWRHLHTHTQIYRQTKSCFCVESYIPFFGTDVLEPAEIKPN